MRDFGIGRGDSPKYEREIKRIKHRLKDAKKKEKFYKKGKN